MAADWNANLYLKFANERTRPAADLLSAVPLSAPETIVDIGCGPGNSTQLLVERYPSARVTGIDTSPDMLAKARRDLPNAEFVQADVASYAPSEKPDLIYGNAVLQWVPDHPTLFPALIAKVASGGALAIQMPDNLDEPSHALMRDVAARPAFSAKLAKAAGSRARIGSFDDHYSWLKPYASKVDMWRTTYVHPLAGAEAIVEWVKATGLRPFLDPLNENEQKEYLALYTQEIAKAYPRQADGLSLLRFPRFFVVAQAT